MPPSGPPQPSYEDLAQLVVSQGGVITELRAEVAELKAEITELKRRLGMDSKNSSKPPSSDGPAKPKSLRTSSGRPPGKAAGATSTTLRQVIDPHETFTHRPATCSGCAADLAGAPVVSVEARQVFDLPEVCLHVVEHRLEHRRCPCGAITMASAPDGVGAPTQYGPLVRGAAVYLSNRQHLPYARCAELLSDLLASPVSAASILAWNTVAAQRLADFTTAVRTQLAACEVAHFDETGARVDGQGRWVHTAATETLTTYLVHEARGVSAFEVLGVLPVFTGIAVHDGWKPYKSYAQALHALCNAHHLRELNGVLENDPAQRWARAMADLLVEIWNQIKTARALHPEASGFTADHLIGYQRRYEEIITAGRRCHPPPPPGPKRKQSKAANLLHRLDVEREQVLRFAVDWRVPFDNNRAEQAVRMVKIAQKISGSWRTIEGAERFLAVRGYLSTAAKQGQNLLDSLVRLFDGRGAWIPAAA